MKPLDSLELIVIFHEIVENVPESTESSPPMRFEDLPMDDRHAAESAASRFLAGHGYVSLDEAGETLDLTLPELWSRIMRDVGLPDCDPPVFAPFA